MATYIDYLRWRGDISFNEVSLNVVDALMMSQLSYLDFRGILPEGILGEGKSISEISELYWKLHTRKELNRFVAGSMRTAGDFLLEMAKTRRFSSLLIKNWDSRLNEETEEQFGAIEIELTERESFLSYCGTDDNLVGWKEDFNMSFLSPIPAQTDALMYLEAILTKSSRRYYIGGHSKGGNLAVYAGVKCKKEYGKRLLRIYNFDGPGFSRSFIEGEDFIRRKSLVETWVPESSVVGMLLEHEEDYQVVKSTNLAVMQHEVISWEIMGSGLITCKEVKKGSRKLAEGVRTFMNGLTAEELRSFCDNLYGVLSATKATTLAELNEEKWKSATQIIKSYNTMDKATKEMIYALIKAVITSSGGKKKAVRKKLAEITEDIS